MNILDHEPSALFVIYDPVVLSNALLCIALLGAAAIAYALWDS